MPEQQAPPSGYTTVHARVRFTEDYQARSTKTGTLDTFKTGECIDPVQIDDPAADPTSPATVWTTEITNSGVCFDFVYIPGSVLEVLDHWPV